MSTSNTIDENYQEAIQSLKKINNELFYDDLKKLMKDREETIAGLSEEVYESIENMQRSMNTFPVQVSDQLKEEVFDPQTQLFNQGMERFDENILVLEKRLPFGTSNTRNIWRRRKNCWLMPKGFSRKIKSLSSKRVKGC